MPASLNNNNSNIAPKEFFKPSEIIRKFNDFLARSSTSAKVMYLRSIYLKSPSNTAYSSSYYDHIKDEDTQDEISIKITLNQRNELKNGNLVDVAGSIERSITLWANIEVFDERPIGELFAKAYENRDWETVVSIGESLMGEIDTLNLSIGYAEALAALGNPQKALNVLDKRLVSNPKDYNLYQTKGNVYLTMEKYDSAITNYERAIDLKPTYARPYIHLGEVYELLGDREKAISNYLIAARLFATNNFFQEANEYGGRVLCLDSTNVEAKGILDLFQQQLTQK